jgi:hypothetical protein
LKFFSHRTYKVWNAESFLSKQARDPKNVLVEFMTRVEIHSDFQRLCGHQVPKIQTLRAYNPEKKAAGRYWLQVQYCLTPFYQAPNTMHLDQKSMRIWRATLDHTTSLWRKSASQAKLCSTLQTAILKGLHIKKIVCFGMGSLSLDPAFYESWIQHLAIFTMAA